MHATRTRQGAVNHTALAATAAAMAVAAARPMSVVTTGDMAAMMTGQLSDRPLRESSNAKSRSLLDNFRRSDVP